MRGSRSAAEVEAGRWHFDHLDPENNPEKIGTHRAVAHVLGNVEGDMPLESGNPEKSRGASNLWKSGIGSSG